MDLLVLAVDKRAGVFVSEVRGVSGGARAVHLSARPGPARITKRVIILTLFSHYSWVVVFYCRLTLYIIIIN